MRKIVIAKALVLAIFGLYLVAAAMADVKVHATRVSAAGITASSAAQ